MVEDFLKILADTLEIKPPLSASSFELPGKGNWDSIALISTMASIHTYFDFSIKPEVLESCNTAQELLMKIEKRDKNDKFSN